MPWGNRRVDGPFVATVRDIPALNRLFSAAFTERYRRDGIPGVRVPFLNPVVWEYAIADAADGAMIWRGARDELVAFNMVHRSGIEGWMGPIAVRLDRQGTGLGQRIVTAGIAHLKESGAGIIGIETMPRTFENIGFYSRLGFRPGPLTITLQSQARPTIEPVQTESLSGCDDHTRSAAIESCRRLTDRLAPGIDFSRELELSLTSGLGEVELLMAADEVSGFALWHHVALAEGHDPADVRVLKLVATDPAVALELLKAVVAEASRRRLHKVLVRCQGDAVELYAALIESGWRVQWTDLRMTLAGFAEPPRAGVVLSNWEI